MPFDSPDLNLGTMLTDVDTGKVQLPDFQREWKWDDPRIVSLLATITLGYPVGVIMMLETGGDDVRLRAQAAGRSRHLDGLDTRPSSFSTVSSG